MRKPAPIQDNAKGWADATIAFDSLLGVPPAGSWYPDRILMMFHGSKLLLGPGSVLARMKVPLTAEVVRRIKTVDIQALVEPDVVADLRQPLARKQLRSLGRFDFISGEYPPNTVFLTETMNPMPVPAFFDNVCKLLRVGGILAIPRSGRTAAMPTFRKELEAMYPLRMSSKGTLLLFERLDA